MSFLRSGKMEQIKLKNSLQSKASQAPSGRIEELKNSLQDKEASSGKVEGLKN